MTLYFITAQYYYHDSIYVLPFPKQKLACCYAIMYFIVAWYLLSGNPI